MQSAAHRGNGRLIYCRVRFGERDSLSRTVRTPSIRTHLLLLVLAISVPFVTVVGLGIYYDVQQTVGHTKTSLRTLTQAMVSNTGGKIADGRLMLERLAARPLVRRVDPRHCDGALRDMHQLSPGFTNITYTDLEGVMLCAAVPPASGKPVNFGQTPWFQQLLRERRFLVSLPYLGPITGKWVAVMGAPIWNERQEMVGTVELPLDLAAFDPHIPAQYLPPNSRYGFVSADGTLVWRNTDPDGVIGTRANSDAVRMMVQVRDGEFQSLSADGVPRYFSVEPMPETGWIAYVGVPVSEVYSAAGQRAMTAVAIALGGLSLLLLLALVIARQIAKPIEALEKAAQAVESGDLEVRATVTGPREIAAVAQGFNTMVEAQQHNVETLKSHVEQLRIAATAFESREGMMVTDANYTILQTNRAITEITGYTAQELIGQTPRMLRSDLHEPDFYDLMWQTVMRAGEMAGRNLEPAQERRDLSQMVDHHGGECGRRNHHPLRARPNPTSPSARRRRRRSSTWPSTIR